MESRNRKNVDAWEQAYEKIQDLILKMKIKPGQAVTETTLSDQLGISRTPVREALKKLEQEGLIITSKRRKRVYILTIKEIEEIFDLKICIEGAVARWAAERADARDLGKLERIVEAMKSIASRRPSDESKEDKWLNRWIEKDKQFHDLLFGMASNNRAQQIIRNYNKQWHRLKLGMLTMEGRVERSAIEHEKVGKAILNRRPHLAEKAMEQHLRNLKRELIKIMKLLHYPTV